MDIFEEKATGYVVLTFKDEDGNAVVPISPTTYTLHDESTGGIINGREDTTVPSLASSIDLELEPDDNVIVTTSRTYEVHILTIKWTYNTDKKGTQEYRFAVENLTKVT